MLSPKTKKVSTSSTKIGRKQQSAKSSAQLNAAPLKTGVKAYPEITPVVHQNTQAKVQRELIRNAQKQAIAFRFRPGVELKSNFLRIAYARVKDGTVSNADLRRLRRHALSVRKTLNDHERMFMAGLLSQENRQTFVDSRGTKRFQFPITSITSARRERINNLDRQAPAAVLAEMQEYTDALARGDLHDAIKQSQELTAASDKAIIQVSGPFKASAKALLRYIKVNKIDSVDVLDAMINAASDNGSGDRLLSGIVYAVAKQAGHSMTGKVKSGQVKIDALTPAAKEAIPEFKGNQASYVSAATASGLKGDTLYLLSTMMITSLYHRSAIIHELNHAKTDAAAPAQGKAQKELQHIEEAKAYKAQAKYIYAQLTGKPAKQQASMAKTLVRQAPESLLTALVVVAKAAPQRRRALLEIINQQFAPPMPARSLDILFAESNAKTEKRLIDAINKAYGINKDPKKRHVSHKDGLRGESILDN